MRATRFAIFLVLAFLPIEVGLASTVRARMKAPIQPEEAPAPTVQKKQERPLRTKAKPVVLKGDENLPQQKKRVSRTEVPGQLNFSSFAIGGHVSEPRVHFTLEPIPLEMVDESFTLDYDKRVREGAAKNDLSL